MYIKCGENIFNSLDIHKNSNDHAKKLKYDKELIEKFNSYLSDLLNKTPNILKPKIAVKSEDGSNQEIDNPLLRDGAYSGEKVYGLIRDKIIEKLQQNGTIVDFKNLSTEDRENQERIILKSIIASRRHSEEALAEYLRSDEFSDKFKKFLGVKKDTEVYNKVKELKIDKVRIDVHSTQESCLPCQVTLRAVKHALEEKFFNKDVAEAQWAAEEIFQIQVSSQEPYDQASSSSSIEPIQYQANGNIEKSCVSDEEINKTTAFLNAIVEYGETISESFNTSYKLQQETKRADNAEEEAKTAAAKKAKEIAKNMIKEGLAIDLINKFTELSIEEIEKLKSESELELDS